MSLSERGAGGYALAMRMWFLVAPVLLSGCSFQLKQIRAQVRGWPGGEGQVAATTGQKRLSESRIDSVGRFTLPLPTPQALEGVLGDLPPNIAATCKSSMRASNPAARYYVLQSISAFPAGGGPALSLISQTRSSAQGQTQRSDQRLLIYASAPSRVQGALNCPSSQTTYSLNLKSGWNHAVDRMTDTDAGKSSSIEDVGDEGFEGWEVAR